MSKIYKYILDERKVMIGKNKTREKSNILLDMMLNTQDDDNEGFNDEKIIAMLVSYTFAGFESVALVASTAIMYLEKHPHFLDKAKVYIPTHHRYVYYVNVLLNLTSDYICVLQIYRHSHPIWYPT